MYQVSLKSEGGRPFFVITWPGITHLQNPEIWFSLLFPGSKNGNRKRPCYWDHHPAV